MPIEILYQDKNVIVCVKPQGIASEDGLPRLLKEQCGIPEIFCVHRLDRTTGGLMVFALTGESAAKLSAQVSGGGMRKEYLAVVAGTPEEPEGTMTDLLYRDAARNKSYVVRRERKGVRKAELSYRVLAGADGKSLVRIVLHTGRTHQIRVQFASRRHPVVGDRRYGSPEDPGRIALWSNRLCFRHPASGKQLCFRSEPPAAEYPWSLFSGAYGDGAAEG